FITQVVHIGLNGLDLLSFRLELIFQYLDTILGELFAQTEAVIAVGFGNVIGEARRIVFVFAINGDSDKLGVAYWQQAHSFLEKLHGLGSFERFTAKVFFPPLDVQVQRFDDFSQNNTILDDFKFGLNEIGIIRSVGHVTANARNVCNKVRFDSDSGRAGVGFGQKERYCCGNNGGNQKNSDDDGLANADDAPIVQEVQPGFLLRLIL